MSWCFMVLLNEAPSELLSGTHEAAAAESKHADASGGGGITALLVALQLLA